VIVKSILSIVYKLFVHMASTYQKPLMMF